MQIISHRGYWKNEVEKNSNTAFVASFSAGFGTETDLRDFNGSLVISHDMANEKSLPAVDFFKLYNTYNNNDPYPLALNIKADGLQKPLLEMLTLYKIENYFLFDMSVPDLRACIAAGLAVYSRLSEYEKDLPFYKQVEGIWLDAFESTWYNADMIAGHLSNGKKICIVSADLHKRDHLLHWEQLKHMGANGWGNAVTLCTDFPELAKSYFDNE